MNDVSDENGENDESDVNVNVNGTLNVLLRRWCSLSALPSPQPSAFRYHSRLLYSVLRHQQQSPASKGHSHLCVEVHRHLLSVCVYDADYCGARLSVYVLYDGDCTCRVFAAPSFSAVSSSCVPRNH